MLFSVLICFKVQDVFRKFPDFKNGQQMQLTGQVVQPDTKHNIIPGLLFMFDIFVWTWSDFFDVEFLLGAHTHTHTVFQFFKY